MEPIALRIPEAALAAGLSRSKIYEEIKARRLRAIKAGGRRLILRTDLEAYFANLASGGDKE